MYIKIYCGNYRLTLTYDIIEESNEKLPKNQAELDNQLNSYIPQQCPLSLQHKMHPSHYPFLVNNSLHRATTHNHCTKQSSMKIKAHHSIINTLYALYHKTQKGIPIFCTKFKKLVTPKKEKP